MIKSKGKMQLKGETIRTLRGRELSAVAGGGGGAGFQTQPSPSFIYSCVVSCTWTADCTTSTTF